MKPLWGRILFCTAHGRIFELPYYTLWNPGYDYSWPCLCGEFHCSECVYLSDGTVIAVYGCGRLRMDPGGLN